MQNMAAEKAQLAMEYFITYGWALIVVATFFGLLSIVYSQPDTGISCKSSSPFLAVLKAANVPGLNSPNNEIALEYLGSEAIKVTAVEFDEAGYFAGTDTATLNGIPITGLSGQNSAEICKSCGISLKKFAINKQAAAEPAVG